MEISQVRYFVTLCRLLNFTRAAEACGVSQPALTRSIQRLEEELGDQLIFRERSRTQLTELGRQIRPHLEAMLASAEAATTLATQRRMEPQRALTIGLACGVGAARVAMAVREVARIIPELTVNFEEDEPSTLVDAMLEDKVHCALLPEEFASHERFHHWRLYADSAVVVLPRESRLASCDVIECEDIASETLLLGETCGDFASRLCEEAEITFNIRRYQGSPPRLFDLIEAGLGIGIVSQQLVLPPTLTARELGAPRLDRFIELAVVAGRPHGEALSAFVKVCRTVASPSVRRQAVEV